MEIQQKEHIAWVNTDGQRAISQHLLDMRYRFRFEYLDEAIKDVLHK